jgi:hypothetical protein
LRIAEIEGQVRGSALESCDLVAAMQPAEDITPTGFKALWNQTLFFARSKPLKQPER